MNYMKKIDNTVNMLVLRRRVNKKGTEINILRLEVSISLLYIFTYKLKKKKN